MFEIYDLSVNVLHKSICPSLTLESACILQVRHAGWSACEDVLSFEANRARTRDVLVVQALSRCLLW